MRRVLSALLVSITALYCVPLSLAQISAHIEKAPGIIRVNVPVKEWLAGNLNWSDAHPLVAKNGSQDTQSFSALPIPFLDIFAPSGQSVYQGVDDAKNASMLRELESSLPNSSGGPAKRGPALSDYVEMIDELKAFRPYLLNGQNFVAFAVSNRDHVKTKLQDGAVEGFRARPGLVVVEITLIFT